MRYLYSFEKQSFLNGAIFYCIFLRLVVVHRQKNLFNITTYAMIVARGIVFCKRYRQYFQGKLNQIFTFSDMIRYGSGVIGEKVCFK